MNTLYNLLIYPFVEFNFMKYALISTIYLSFSSSPIGVFLVYRRMSLVGDAIGHAILPGVALGYLYAGFNILYMSFFGMIAGFLVFILSQIISRVSVIKEDASFTVFYLFALDLGVLLVSKYGENVDLLNFLFGSILTVSKDYIFFILLVLTFTLILLAIIYRVLILDIVDPLYLDIVKSRSLFWELIFIFLVVINFVAGFQILGTLMSVGLIMIPAITAKLWSRTIIGNIVLAIFISLVCSYTGLIISYYIDVSSGPTIVFCCSVLYIFSLFFSNKNRLYKF